MRLQVHVFQLHEDGPAAEELEEDCDVSAANHWMLPSGKSQSDIHNTCMSDLHASCSTHAVNVLQVL